MEIGYDVFERMVRDFALREGEMRRDGLIADVVSFENLLRDTYQIEVDLLSVCIKALEDLDNGRVD